MTKKTSIKHEAILPDGSVAKRTSENRTYAFAIAFRLGYEESIAFAKDDAAHSDTSNGRYFLNRAAGKPEVLYRDTPEAARAEALEELDGATTVAEYAAAQVAKRIADLDAKNAAGDFAKWSVDGWASRDDLAEKAAAKVSKYRRVAEVRIVLAKVVAK